MVRLAIMKSLAPLSLAAMLLAGADASAQAQDRGSAYSAGLNIARKRGYAHPGCFAGVFARHARPHPDGRRNHWVASAGRAYQGELWSQCGISR
ncbi:hypothetical protein FHT98_0691 [Bosea sp. AK1]|nr:hypothetical protein FHT98_0691 [Bosea sp. AK1]